MRRPNRLYRDVLQRIAQPLRNGPSYSSSAKQGQGHEPLDIDADVIVVGAGLAGACAAVAAAQAGASVTLLDRAHGGGASALSGGIVYAGGGTRQQHEAGYGTIDTPDNFLAYMRAEVGSSGVVDDATLRRFCEGSAERLEWLESLGAKFDSSLCPYKTSYPTDRHYLYFSGSETASGFVEKAVPAPRGHRAVAKGFTSGATLWDAVFASATRLGVRFFPATKVEGLRMGRDGQVTGVEVRTLAHDDSALSQHKRRVKRSMNYILSIPGIGNRYWRQAESVFDKHACRQVGKSKAVVLAAGGFTCNENMTTEHIPAFHSLFRLGTPGDDGSGIILGLGAGGSVSHMDRFTAWRFLSPPSALLEGIVISADGHRIGAEDVYGDRLARLMILEHGGKGYLILDATQWAKAKSQVTEQLQMPITVIALSKLYWSYKKAGSIRDLADKLGLPEAQMQASISAYNQAITDGQDDPVGKLGSRSPVAAPPFYAIDVSARRTGVDFLPGITLGGLRVDGETGLVLDIDDQPVGHLYAAGRNAVGVCSNSYVSGLSLADCVFSGQRAGRHAAEMALANT